MSRSPLKWNTIKYEYNKRIFFVRLLRNIAAMRNLRRKSFFSSRCSPEILRHSFKCGLDARLTTSTGDSLLTYVCRYYSLGDLYDVVDALLKNGVDPNQLNRAGNNAIHALLLNDRLQNVHALPDVVRLLHRFKIDVNHANKKRLNALWMLTGRFYNCETFFSVSRALLDCGINVRYQPLNQTGNPLLKYIQGRNFLSARYLYDLVQLYACHGVKLTDITEDGENVMILAAKICYVECSEDAFFDLLSFLLRSGVDVNHTDNKRRNVLNVLAEQHTCHARSFLKVLRFLIASGVDVSNVDVDGANALVTFLYNVDLNADAVLDVISTFAGKGVGLTHANFEDFNALLVLIERREIPLDRLLVITRHFIELGVNVANKGHSILLELFDNRLDREIGDYETDDEPYDEEEEDSYASAIEADDETDERLDEIHDKELLERQRREDEDWYDIIKLLLDHGDDPNAFDSSREVTPLLMLCARYKGANLSDVIRLMFGYGMNVNSTWTHGPDLNPVLKLRRNNGQRKQFSQVFAVLVECGIDGVDLALDVNRRQLFKGINIGGNIVQWLNNRSLGLFR